jgi:hypothetical protein
MQPAEPGCIAVIASQRGKAPPDDRLREAIHGGAENWIASSLRSSQ